MLEKQKPEDAVVFAREHQAVHTLWLREYERLGLNEAIARARAEARTYQVIGPHTVVPADPQFHRLNLHVDPDGSLTGMTAG